MLAAKEDLSVFAQEVPSVIAIDLDAKWLFFFYLKLLPLELMKFLKLMGSSFLDFLFYFLVFFVYSIWGVLNY